VRTAKPDIALCAFSRTRPKHLCSPLTNDSHGSRHSQRRIDVQARATTLEEGRALSQIDIANDGAAPGGIAGRDRKTLGLAAMLLVTPVLKAMLYGTGSRNPVVLVGVCCWSLIPAWLPVLAGIFLPT